MAISWHDEIHGDFIGVEFIVFSLFMVHEMLKKHEIFIYYGT
jgi:hypothetical protein